MPSVLQKAQRYFKQSLWQNILAFYIPNGDLNSQYYLLPNASSRKYNTNGMFWPMEDVFQNRHHFVLVKHL